MALQRDKRTAVVGGATETLRRGFVVSSWVKVTTIADTFAGIWQQTKREHRLPLTTGLFRALVPVMLWNGVGGAVVCIGSDVGK